MKSRMHQLMNAPFERVFELAAGIERWPDILPHYRYVRAIGNPAERRFAMGARRGPLPVSWEAVQRPMQAERRIEFTHTGGVTRGMRVAWRFDETPAGLDVSIEHELHLDWPMIGGFAAERIIGPHFIDAIAGRTLRRIRDIAERTP